MKNLNVVLVNQGREGRRDGDGDGDGDEDEDEDGDEDGGGGGGKWMDLSE